LRGHRLVALEALAEVVRADQPAADQHVERPVDGRGPDVLALLLQSLLDGFGGETLVAGQDLGGDEVALPGDGEGAVVEVTAKALEEARAFAPTEPGHRSA